jgi:HEAT repeat protein
MVTLFGSSDLGATGRGLVLDVLSVAGDHDAQVAMRDALSLDVAREDRDGYTFGLQRFIFLRTPERESAAFLTKILDDAEAAHDVRVQGASAVALGGVVHALRLSGERDAAEQYHGRLFRDLAHAAPGDERVYMLRAVGNAATAGDDGAISTYAKDENRVVRDQVAHSLRHVQSPAAHETLFSLAGDADDMVATTAIRALRDQTMTEAEWTDLAGRVASGKTNQASDSAMVNLVRERQGEAAASGEAILRTILGRTSPSNPDLLTTIRALLGIEAPG